MKLSIARSGFQKVSEIEIPSIFYNRIKSGVTELDEMFGDGILPGSATTITAQAGLGKTTFLLQLMEALAVVGYDVGYASGEENQYQLAFNCRRLGVNNVAIANETDVDTLAAAMKDLDVLVVDSFQALTTDDKKNNAELERYATSTLVNAAKKHECAVFFVMHLTKNGQLKGSSLVPHSVDVNIQIMQDEEGDSDQRIIDFYKNRFGRTATYSAVMSRSGFTFAGERQTVVATSKKTRRKDELKKVLEMKEPPGITKQRIIKELNVTSSQAYLILKELTDTGKLVKYGRGESSIWKHATVTASVK